MMYDIIITDLDTDCKTMFKKVEMSFILDYLKRFETKLKTNKKEGEQVLGKHSNKKMASSDITK
jgi:hypothetical protein